MAKPVEGPEIKPAQAARWVLDLGREYLAVLEPHNARITALGRECGLSRAEVIAEALRIGLLEMER